MLPCTQQSRCVSYDAWTIPWTSHLPRTPDFLIAGAAKCGTTSLHRYLSEHPQVFATRHKELNYFAYDDPVVTAGWPDLPFPVQSWDEYCAAFANAGDNQLAFEASPIYFDSPMAPVRIARTLPAAKILISLRDPRERAWSGYLMHIREGEKPVPEKDFIDPSARYIAGGFYANKLSAYQDIFGDRLKVVLFDDIRSDIESVMRSIFDFIGIGHFVSDSYARRHNVASYPRFRPINAVLTSKLMRHRVSAFVPRPVRRLGHWMLAANSRRAPVMQPELRSRLGELYRDDIEKVAALLGRDLSGWLD